jgi:putative spermidine/putrescine transport system permease protein
MLLGFVSALDESQGTLIVGLPDYRTVPLLMYDVINSYPLSVGGVFSLFLSLPSVIVLIVAIRVLTRSQLVPGAVT